MSGRTLRIPLIAAAAGLLAAVVACAPGGCRKRPTVKTVDLSAGRLPEGAAIVIDGMTRKEEWRHGASMPFERTGIVRFAWDDTAICGYLQKYEHQKLGFSPDERICVRVAADDTEVLLYYPATWRPDQRDWTPLAVVGKFPFATEAKPLPAEFLESKAGVGPTKQGLSWSIEFRLRWEALGVSSPAAHRVRAGAHRIVPQPATHVMTMGPPAPAER